MRTAQQLAEIEAEIAGIKALLASKRLRPEDLRELRERAVFARSIFAGMAAELDEAIEKSQPPLLQP